MVELLHPEWSAEKVEKLKGHYEAILSLLGEDVEREGLLKTPERVAKAMLTLTRGYEQDPHAILLGAKFQEEYSQMVIVKDIDFFSLCEHHISLTRQPPKQTCPKQKNLGRYAKP